jgi:hypothetical protein
VNRVSSCLKNRTRLLGSVLLNLGAIRSPWRGMTCAVAITLKRVSEGVKEVVRVGVVEERVRCLKSRSSDVRVCVRSGSLSSDERGEE